MTMPPTTTPTLSATNGGTPTPPSGPAPRISPVLSELLRLRGHPRREIRAKAEELADAIWRSRPSERARRNAVVYTVERLLFDGAGG